MKKLLFIVSVIMLANLSHAAEPSKITNGVTTVQWNDAKKQVEIAKHDDVYAIIPLENASLDTQGKTPHAATEMKNRDCFVLRRKKTESDLDDYFTLSISKDKSGVSASWVQIERFQDFGESESGEYLHKFPLPEIQLDLPAKTDVLKSFGTAGLRAVNAHKGSYMFLAVVDPETNDGVVSGWLTAKESSGIVFSGKSGDAVTITPECQFGKKTVNNNDGTKSEPFVIGRFHDARIGLEDYATLVAEAAGVKLKPIPLAGYCTWYSNKHAGACDENHLRELADACERELKPFGFGFIQIDDNWQLGETDNGPKKNFTAHNPKGPYPNGMKPTADMLDKHGFTAGLWFMPFSGNKVDPHFPKDWFAKSGATDEVNADGKSKRPYNSIVNKEGEPYESFWGGTSLDMSNPDVQKYLAEEVKRIHNDWGYNYFKLDGLWTGLACDQLYVNDEYREDDLGDAVFHDADATPVSVYRKGFEIIRSVAPDVFILGCNVSQNMRMMHPSIGYCDAMRVGPDNGAGWGALKTGPWHSSNRYFLNGRVWWNDPDPVFVRDTMPIEHARLIASWVAISGNLYAFSDWLPELSRERIEILQKTMRPHGLTTVRPVDLFEQDLPRIWVLTDTKNGIRRDVVAFYNWNDKESTVIEVDTKKLGIPIVELSGNAANRSAKGSDFFAFDFWKNEMWKGQYGESFGSKFRVELPPGSCKVFSIREIKSNPVLLSTSEHVTQGIIDVAEEKWDEEKKELSGKSVNVASEIYELRICVPENVFSRDKVEVKATNATVESIEADKDSKFLLRVKLKPQGGPITWDVRFF